MNSNLYFLVLLLTLVSCDGNKLQPLTYCSNANDAFLVSVDQIDARFCKGGISNDSSLVVDSLNIVGYQASNDSLTLRISFSYKEPSAGVLNEVDFLEFYNYFERLYIPKSIHSFEEGIVKNQGKIVVELWNEELFYSTLLGPQDESTFSSYSIITEFNGLMSPVDSPITIAGSFKCTVYSETGSQKQINAFIYATVAL